MKRALVTVARSGNQELFELLLAKKPEREALAGALYQAADAGNVGLVRELLDHGLTANDDWGGHMPLEGAAYYNHADVVKLLLSRGAKVNAVNRSRGGNGETALHYATRERDRLEVVRMLLKGGAAANVQDNNGNTPLMNALQYHDVALLLLAAGADVNARTKDQATALIYAAGRELVGMIRVLVKEGADINAQTNKGQTALMWASGAISSVDQPDTVQVLLDHGADMNPSDKNGWTALMYAAEQGLTGAARVLIRQGANLQKRNNRGQTALQLANASKRDQIVAMLNKPRG